MICSIFCFSYHTVSAQYSDDPLLTANDIASLSEIIGCYYTDADGDYLIDAYEFSEQKKDDNRIETMVCDFWFGEMFKSPACTITYYSDAKGGENGVKDIIFTDGALEILLPIKLSYTRDGTLTKITHYSK